MISNRSPASFVVWTLLIFLVLLLFPFQHASANELGQVVVEDNLNVRNAPSTKGDIIGKLQNGDEVEIIEKTGEWLKVSSKVGEGFVHSDFVSIHTTTQEEESSITSSSNENNASSSQKKITVYVNGDLLELPIEPPIIDGRVLVPFRGIGENLGIEVTWLSDTRQVLATAPNKTVIFTINNPSVIVNDDVVSINPAPTIIEDRTVIPLRFFAESFGANVEWDADEKTITIEKEDPQNEDQENVSSENEEEDDNTQVESEDDTEDTELSDDDEIDVTAKAVIDVDTVIVYEEPSKRSDELDELELGDVVFVYTDPLDEELDTEKWLQIEYDDDIAYIEADSIRPIEDTIIGKVKATSLNIRQDPDIESPMIGSLLDGEEIVIYEIDGNWAHIKHYGYWGYVHTNYLELKVNEQTYAALAEPKIEIYDSNRAWLSWSKIGAVTTSHQLFDNGVEIITNATNIDELENIDHPAIRAIDYEKSEGNSVIKIYFHSNYHFVVRHSINDVRITLLNDGLEGKRIVVDAGHGDHDPGAKGATGLYEKEVNLAIALKLNDLLRNAGAEVILTRSDDTFLSLEERVQVAHEADADVFVSIHADSYKTTSQGSTTFYHSGKNPSWQQSKQLSDITIKHLTSQLGTVNRGSNDKSLHVIRETEIPAILVEVAFLSNPSEEALLKTDAFRQQAAQAIFDSLEEFYD